MLTAKDLEKYHQAAERILNAMDNSPVPIRLARNGQNGIAERYRKGIDSH